MPGEGRFVSSTWVLRKFVTGTDATDQIERNQRRFVLISIGKRLSVLVRGQAGGDLLGIALSPAGSTEGDEAPLLRFLGHTGKTVRRLPSRH